MAKIGEVFHEVKKTDPHLKKNFKWIHYTKLHPHPKQYRMGTTPDEIAQFRERVTALAWLIRADGKVLDNLNVRRTGPDEYEIIAGHHRMEACRYLAEEEGQEQFAFLPCDIENISDVRAEFELYSSNGYSKKTDFEIMHELEQMKYLISHYPEEFPELQTGRMVERLAKKFGKKRSTVSEYMKISKNLCEDAMQQFKVGKIDKSAAVELASFTAEEQKTILDQGLMKRKDILKYKDEKREEDVPKVGTQQKGEEENVPKAGTQRKEKEDVPKAGTQRKEKDEDVPKVGTQRKEEDEDVPKAGTQQKEKEDVPKVGTLPELKNDQEREAFVNAYGTWQVWCTNPYTEETFYRHDLPDGSAIIVKEYPYSDYWDKKKERIGKNLYLLLPGMKHFKNAESNMTEIKGHLKSLRRRGGSK